MKRFYAAVFFLPVFLAISLFCSCQTEEAPHSETDTVPVTEAVTETTADTEEETETQTVTVAEDWLSLSAVQMDVDTAEGTVSLLIRGTPKSETVTAYHLSVTVSSDEAGTDAVFTQTVIGADEQTVTFPYPAEKQADLLYIQVSAVPTDEDKKEAEPITLSLRIKNGLPQLTPDGVALVVSAMTDEEKAHMITGIQKTVQEGASGGTYAIDRLSVPSITVNDGPAGVRYGTAVWYPSIANISSSWDTELIGRVGQSIGEDALAIGIDVVLGPGMNIQKNALGGRNFEYSSEDPLLTGLLMSAYISGMQSTGTGACIKHYAANNQESSRGTVSADVTERALREIYLKGFGIAIKNSQPWTVMSSYNCLNGVHTCKSWDLLTGILREEFGFEGFVMTDWGATSPIADKVNAGNDINMPGDTSDADTILTALEKGTVKSETLDTCCRNILSVVAKSAVYNNLHKGRVNQSEKSKLNQKIAPDTIVLLKNNDSTLPLTEGKSVALFGNGAAGTVFGGQGSGAVSAQKTVSIWSAIQSSKTLTLYDANGNPFRNAPAHDAKSPDSDIEVTDTLATRYAAGADVAVIVISRDTSEGADHTQLAGDYCLSAREADMMAKVSDAFHKQNKKVIVILNTGNPIEVMSWRDSVDAVIWCGYAGQNTGNAVVSVLTGAVNPSAKLTATWPTSYLSTPAVEYFPGNSKNALYYEDIYVGYRYYSTFDVPVAYEFGYGLSYTTFEYSDFTVETDENGTVTLSVTVQNTGSVAGREVVEFYVSKPETTQEQPVRELCGFGKTALLQSGESERVTVTVTEEALETYVTEISAYIIDKGVYTFAVGASVADIKASATVEMKDSVTVLDTENRCSPKTELNVIHKDTYTVPTEQKEQPVNLALNKKAWSDHCEGDSYAAQNAVDGDYMSRWSGLGTASSVYLWQVDLEDVYELGQLHIRWESVSAPFTVWLSEDGTNFTKWKTVIIDGSCEDFLNLAGAKARVVRLTVPKGGYCSIYECMVYEATEEDRKQTEEETQKVNVAQGKNVTATNVQDAFKAANAVDGNVESRWAATQQGEASITVDLGQSLRIDGITIILEAAWVPYQIECSTDGETWTTVAEGDKDQMLLTADNLQTDARFVRVKRLGEDWFSIFEICVYQE